MPEYKTHNFDVLIVGAGGAGLRAAIEASAARLRVHVAAGHDGRVGALRRPRPDDVPDLVDVDTQAEVAHPAHDQITTTSIVVGEFGALLTSVRLLEELVPDVGVKLTVKVVDFPGANVSGIARPVRPNPVPGPANCVTLRLAVPGLLNVTVCEFV